MSDNLIDPSKPPHALVEVRDDGSALRNDGLELKAANADPWYVLATVNGEQDGDGIDPELHAKNRRIWNGWACGSLGAAERESLAARLKLPAEALAPLTEDETGQVKAAFADRLPVGALDGVALGADGLPDPEADVDLSKTHFSHTVVWEKCVFSGPASFKSATFSGPASFKSATFSGSAWFWSATFSGRAWFDSATFSGPAWFGSATFSGDASFESATFSGLAWFGSATFSGRAWFASATFSGDASFGSATFSGPAWFESATFSGFALFESATFSGFADFSDGVFAARTAFKEATFETQVPAFYQRRMHQNTSFTTANANWPAITADNAEDGKQAYTRLRQLMNQLEKPDDAHFFFRQEMRCKAITDEKPLDRWANRAFGALSDYGHSLSRPLIGLLGFWLGPAVVYMAYFGWMCGMHGSHCHTPLAPFGLSFANLFSFLGLARLYFGSVLPLLPGGLQFLSGIQTVAGFILLFFLGLGLRNHFRLK